MSNEINKEIEEGAGYEAIFNTSRKEYKFINAKLHFRFKHPYVHPWERCEEWELNDLIKELLDGIDISSYILRNLNKKLNG